MKKITISLVAVMATLALNCPLYAAGDYQQSQQKSQTSARQSSSSSQSAQELLGMKIVSPQGEEIGQIEDIKLNTQSGRINHVTVSKGAVLGVGGEKIAVPLAAFSFDAQADQATLTVDKSKLDNAPQQANMSDDEFSRELQSHYGVSPTWQQQSEPEQMMQKMQEGQQQQKGNY